MEFKQLKISGSGYKEVGNDNAWYSPENSDVIEWLKTNTPEPEFTDEELEAKEISEKLSEAKQYLVNTDWIIVKINEAQLLNKDIQPLLTKYSVELAEREAKRTIINSLES